MIGFIGGGNMAEAIIRGLIRNEHGWDATDFDIYDPAAERCETLRLLGCRILEKPEDVCASPMIFLAVKPQQVKAAIAPIANLLDRKLLVSIVAGVSTRALAAWLPEKSHLVRVMPNLSLIYSAGVTAVTYGGKATAKDAEFVASIFEQLGTAILLPEKYFDAVTAVTGSGPAYVFLLAEMLEQAAMTLGLPAEISAKLARETVTGAAKILARSDESAATWRARVTSEGGTTAAALNYLQQQNFTDIFVEAVKQAAARSAELGV